MLRKFLLFLALCAAAVGQTNFARMIAGVNYQSGATYSLQPADTTKLVSLTNAGSAAVCLSSPTALCSGVAAGSGTFYGAGSIFSLNSSSATTTTITCQSSCTINGSTTLVLNPGVGADIYGDGTNFAAVVGFSLPGSTGTKPAQIGDALRFGVNGDGVYDAVNAAQVFRSFTITPDPSNGAVDCQSGVFGGASTGSSVGSRATVNPTLTAGMANTYSAAASASTNTVLGIICGENGNQTLFPILAFNRFSHKLKLGQVTSARYWIGLGVWCSGGCSPIGGNGSQPLGTSGYTSDLPNKTVLGFRYSDGTDTHWQCISNVAGASVPTNTVVDTGIAPDTTTIHLYEGATNLAGTSFFCLIDGNVVGTISTNLPVPGADGNTLVAPFWSGDNKNTNTAISATWYWSALSLK